MSLPKLSRLPARPMLVSALLAGFLLAGGDDVGLDPVADTPAAVVLVTAPAATVVTGAPLAPQPVVEVRNAEGAAVRRAGIVVEVSSSVGTLGGTTSIPTDSEGRATFTDLSLSGQEGAAELRFSCCDLPPATRAVSLSHGENPLTAASATSVEQRAGSEMIPGPGVRIDGGALREGIVVRFTLAGPGSVPQATAITNAEGVAELPSYRFGDIPGTSILTATIEGTNHQVQFRLTSTLAGVATIHDEGVSYSGRPGEPFTLPVIEITDGDIPLPGVEVRFRTFTDVAPPITHITNAAGRIEGVSLPLSAVLSENVFEVFAVGYMPAPVTLKVLGVEHPPVRLVTDAPANVLPLEDALGSIFLTARLVDALGEPVTAGAVRVWSDGDAGTFSWWDMWGAASGSTALVDEYGSVYFRWGVPAAPGTYRIHLESEYVANPVTFTAVRGE